MVFQPKCESDILINIILIKKKRVRSACIFHCRLSQYFQIKSPHKLFHMCVLFVDSYYGFVCTVVIDKQELGILKTKHKDGKYFSLGQLHVSL